MGCCLSKPNEAIVKPVKLKEHEEIALPVAQKAKPKTEPATTNQAQPSPVAKKTVVEKKAVSEPAVKSDLQPSPVAKKTVVEKKTVSDLQVTKKAPIAVSTPPPHRNASYLLKTAVENSSLCTALLQEIRLQKIGSSNDKDIKKSPVAITDVKNAGAFPVRRKPGEWATIRVFISSTFVDMHGERDSLIRVVFPRLNKMFREKLIRFTPVDLRWGVSAEETSKIQQTCLNEIDHCRPGKKGERDLPWFIGLRGERYGWVQDKYDAPSAFEQPELYGWLAALEQEQKRVSITSLEVYQAFLAFSSVLAASPPPNIHSFCYFRDPAFNQTTPPELRWIFDFDFRAAPTGKPDDVQYTITEKSDQYHADLVEINEAIKAATHVCSSAVYHPTYGRAEITGSLGEGKKKFGCGWTGSMEGFENQVCAHLTEAADKEYAPVDNNVTPQEADNNAHVLYAESKCTVFVGRTEILAQLSAYCGGKEAVPPMIVYGEAGTGKSALMAKFISQSVSSNLGKTVVIAHLVGATASSIHLRPLLQRLIRELQVHSSKKEPIPAFSVGDMKSMFFDLLNEVAKKKQIVIIIDAVNQMSPHDYAHQMHWLPAICPANVRILLSSLQHTTLDNLKVKEPKPTIFNLENLSVEERKQVVRLSLMQYHKKLNEDVSNEFLGDQMGALLKKEKSDNVLFLSVAVQALREFGVYEKLTAYIQDILPGSLSALFDHFLDTLEATHGRSLLRNTLSLLYLSTGGLFESELVDVLALCPKPPSSESKSSNFATIYGSLAYFLASSSGSGLLQLFHQQLTFVVKRRYLSTFQEECMFHQLLFDYYLNSIATCAAGYERALVLAPHHARLMKNWVLLEGMLCDVVYLEAMIRCGLHLELLQEFKQSILALKEEVNSAAVLVDTTISLRNIQQFSRFFSARLYQFIENPHTIIGSALNFVEGPVSGSALALHAREGGSSTGGLITTWRSSTEDACVFDIPFQKRAITVMALSCDGAYMVSGHHDELTLVLWAVETGVLVEEYVIQGAKKHDKFSALSFAFSKELHQQGLVCYGTEAGSVGVVDMLANVSFLHVDGIVASKVNEIEFSSNCTQLLVAARSEISVVSIAEKRMLGTKKLKDGSSYDKVYVIFEGQDRNVHVISDLYENDPLQIFAPVGGMTKQKLAAAQAAVLTTEILSAQYGHKLWNFFSGGMCLSADQKTLAVATKDYLTHSIGILDLASGNLMQRMYGHNKDIVTLEFDSKQTGILVSGCEEGLICVWAWQTGALLMKLTAHTQKVTRAYMYNDRIVSMSIKEKVMRVFDVGPAVTQFAKNPLGDLILNRPEDEPKKSMEIVQLSPDGSQLLTLSLEGVLLVWDRKTGAQIKEAKLSFNGRMEGRYPSAAAASPVDWEYLCLGTSSTIHMLKLRDWLATPNPKEPIEPFLLPKLAAHDRCDIAALAFTPDGAYLASCAADKRICLWKISDRKLVSGKPFGVNIFTARLMGCVVAPDASWVAGVDTDGNLAKIDTKTGNALWNVPCKRENDYFSITSLGLCFAEGLLIVAVENKQNNLLLFRLADGSRAGSLDGLLERCISTRISVTADGQFLLANGWSEGGAVLFHMPSRRLYSRLTTCKDLCDAFISSNGSSIAVCNERQAMCFDVTSLLQQRALELTAPPPSHSNAVSVVTVSATNNMMASACLGSSDVKLWTLPSVDAPSNSLPDLVHLLLGEEDGNDFHVIALRFYENGSKLVAFCNVAFTVWDTKSGSQLERLPEQKYLNAFCNPSGGYEPKRLVISSWGGTAEQPSLALASRYDWQVLDGATGAVVQEQDKAGEDSYCVALHPAMVCVATVGYHGRMNIYNLHTFKNFEVQKKHNETGSCMAISSDNRMVCGTYSGKLFLVHLWEEVGVQAPSPTMKLGAVPSKHAKAITAVAWTKDNRFFLSAGADSTVVMTNANTFETVTVFALGSPARCLVVQEPYVCVGDELGRIYVTRLM